MPYALITPDIGRRRTAYMRRWRQRNRAARNAYNRRWMAQKRKALHP